MTMREGKLGEAGQNLGLITNLFGFFNEMLVRV